MMNGTAISGKTQKAEIGLLSLEKIKQDGYT